MNAQEAIDKLQTRLDFLNKRKEYVEAHESVIEDLYADERRLLLEEIEALSIVLTSAKMLHDLIDAGHAVFEGDILEVQHDYTVHIPIDLQQKLGIEEGVDE